jgi:Domain of unknown function (DUF6883)
VVDDNPDRHDLGGVPRWPLQNTPNPILLPVDGALIEFHVSLGDRRPQGPFARKLRDYLLSRLHPVGRFKAPFFASLGYGADNWQDGSMIARSAPGSFTRLALHRVLP